MMYYKKGDVEKLYSEQCCSITIDDDEEPAISLQQFVTSTKNDRWCATKIKLTDTLENNQMNRFNLFTMTQEPANKAIHIVEELYRDTNDKA